MKRLSRRSILRGTGVALALPWLEAMNSRRAFAQTGPADASGPPTRFLAYYVPNGMNLAEWEPLGSGADFQLSPIMQPLAPVKEDILVLSGLANRAGLWTQVGAHGAGTASFLTNTRLPHGDGGVWNTQSVDQAMAEAIGSATAFPSLQVGIDGGGATGVCESGDSCAFTRNISWADADSPLAKEVNPRALFDRLVGDRTAQDAEEARKRRRYRRSVLDYVRTSARNLQSDLGTSDRAKLDEYLTGVRELETRIDAFEIGPQCEGTRPEAPDFVSKVRAMADLMVLAFRCDLTRIITFMLANAASNRIYGFLGIEDPHHDISHHQNDPRNLERLKVINTWEVEQLSYLIQALKRVPEGEGTLLDHTILYFGSEISDGDAHGMFDLPIVVAGRGGGALRPGRRVVYEDATSTGKLFVSFLQAMGIERSTFGDGGSEPLPGLV